ncbi:VOC family protein [Nocardioides panacis]|uniref:VOC family protein n=1 Tax=Nocardioides panacis TaxID=2849501 RepID=A0A975SX43_9ACTN|nr:VOC family protein [Nocardioides panacis]QWZ07456.1 VOC family protein [Nocardioides panacis]
MDEWTLTFDCDAAGRLAEFWKVALGYVDAPPPQGWSTWEDWLRELDVPEDEWDDAASIVDPAGGRARISFLKVPEAKAAKNRIHLDVQVGGGRHLPHAERWPRIEATVQRLTAAGATVLAEVGGPDRPDHVVMADPEGNEFCVV